MEALNFYIVFVLLALAFNVYNVRSVVLKLRKYNQMEGDMRVVMRQLYMRTAYTSIVGIVAVHFAVLFYVDAESSRFALETYSDKTLAVLDVMAKGALFYLFECFDVCLVGYQVPEGWKLLDSVVQFLCRTGYSVAYAALAFGYWNAFQDWRKRD